jgi:hypothetical protein
VGRVFTGEDSSSQVNGCLSSRCISVSALDTIFISDEFLMFKLIIHSTYTTYYILSLLYSFGNPLHAHDVAFRG